MLYSCEYMQLFIISQVSNPNMYSGSKVILLIEKI